MPEHFAKPSERPAPDLSTTCFPTPTETIIVEALYQNVGGMRTKLNDCFHASTHCLYSIIAVSETWLVPSIKTAEFMQVEYEVFRCDRDRAASGLDEGGDVLIAVNKQLSPCRLKLINFRPQVPFHIDIVGAKVTFQHRPVFIFVVYIPSPATSEDLDSVFEFFVSQKYIYDKNVLILGDFNVKEYASYLEQNAIDSQNSVLISSLLNILEILDLKQHNLIKNENNRLLDLVLYKSEHCKVERAIDPLLREVPHHPALAISLKTDKKSNCDKKLPQIAEWTYNFRKADFPQLYSKMLHSDWSFLQHFDNIDEATDAFYEYLYSLFDSCVPKRPKFFSKKYPCWYSSTIIKNIRKKSNLHKKLKKDRSMDTYQEFSDIRQRIKDDISIAYRQYVRRVENSIKQNPNVFWSFLHSKSSNGNIPDNMSHNEIPLDTTAEIVDGFADFFGSSFNPIDNGPLSYSNDQTTMYSPLSIKTFNQDETCKVLRKLKSKPTAGPDLIPSYIIKDCAFVLCKPLTTLFNLCLSNKRVPSVWKISRISPIHKKGDRTDIANYRPITIINNFLKCFETLLHNGIYPSLKNRISSDQHGFMKGRSTITNLVETTQDIAEALDTSSQLDIIYTDLSKAFDKLDHRLLIQALSHFGISDDLTDLFKSLVTGRQQYVEINGVKSKVFAVTSGVPQGSVLGPLLFDLFIDSISNCLKYSKIRKYADDIKLASQIESIADCYNLQSDLTAFSEWCQNHKLSVNISKCQVMTFSLKTKPIIFDYSIKGTLLSRPDAVCDLGVVFDPKITFTKHLEVVISESTKAYGFLARVSRDFEDIDTIKLLYFSFIRSKLEYASIVWSPQLLTHKESLEKIQRRLLKFLHFKSTGSYPPQGYPHSDLLQMYQMQSLESRRECFSQIFLYKVLHNQIDSIDITYRLNFRVPRLNSRQSPLFYLPAARVNAMKFSPLHVICNIHNNKLLNIDIFNCCLSAIRRVFARPEK